MVVHLVIGIHEVLGVCSLEYELNAHECVYHFIDIFVEYSRWIHHNFIKRKHVPKNLFMTCSNHVFSYLFVIAINCGPLLLAIKPISNVCVLSKSHHNYGMIFFTFHDCTFE
jgi:hypothetical protein